MSDSSDSSEEVKPISKGKQAKSGTKNYQIKPASGTPQLSTASWPLLLKNYD